MSSHFEDRRKALVRFVNTGFGLMAAALAGLMGAAATPKTGADVKRWRKAASIFDLPPNTPFAAVHAEPRADGRLETSKQSVVYIDREGDGYRALSATCSHLGCRVSWNVEKSQYLCPCHGGTYDRNGKVIAGPPPAGLRRLNLRVNPQSSEIEVEL
jgi:nitrite reductase/ring-hydroxylating ferredoxin subunit